MDLGVLERVDGSGRQRQFFERLAERVAQILLAGRALGLRLFDRRTRRQRAEVATQEAGRALERVLGADGAVGPDLDYELLVVGDLAQP